MTCDKKKYRAQWYKKNKKQKDIQSKEWRNNNPECLHKLQKRWYSENRLYHKIRKVKTRLHWLQILNSMIGEPKCSTCGYSKCFAALDFHHDNPNEKEEALRYLIQLKPTKARIARLKGLLEKGKFLCATCHRETHHAKEQEEQRTICIDFDGTIHAYSEGFRDGTIYDTPIDGAIKTIKELIKFGYKIVVWTSRDKTIPLVKKWLLRQGIDVMVTNIKIPALCYIDDLAIHFTNWNTVMKKLESRSD